MVPLPRTCLIPGILVILPPSAASQSTVGAGFPLTMQSTRPPFTFVNSTRDGGSDTKLGPCISYEASQPVTKPVTRYISSYLASFQNRIRNDQRIFLRASSSSKLNTFALYLVLRGNKNINVILCTRLVIRSATVSLALTIFLKGRREIMEDGVFSEYNS